MSDRESVERFLDTISAVQAGIDLDEAYSALREGIQAIRKQLEALNAVDYKSRVMKLTCPECEGKVEFKAPWKPDELARAASHTMKVNDELARLAQFAKGLPDSRPDMGMGNRDVLQLLTPDQLRVFEGWVTEAMGRG